jgi:ABC-2 type transport system permease protein
MPTVLIIILYFVFSGNKHVFDTIAPSILGIIPFTLMFIVTSVAMLRERTSGTLERLLTSPASKLDILMGYALAFAILALAQAAIATLVTLTLLNVNIAGAPASLLVIAVLSGVLGMAFGLLFSAFARNEFQAVQFMPAFVLPQFLICGLLYPRDMMAGFLQFISEVMPLTYVVKALQEVRVSSEWTTALSFDVTIMCGFTIVALVLGALSLRSK